MMSLIQSASSSRPLPDLKMNTTHKAEIQQTLGHRILTENYKPWPIADRSFCTKKIVAIYPNGYANPPLNLDAEDKITEFLDELGQLSSGEQVSLPVKTLCQDVKLTPNPEKYTHSEYYYYGEPLKSSSDRLYHGIRRFFHLENHKRLSTFFSTIWTRFFGLESQRLYPVGEERYFWNPVQVNDIPGSEEARYSYCLKKLPGRHEAVMHALIDREDLKLCEEAGKRSEKPKFTPARLKEMRNRWKALNQITRSTSSQELPENVRQERKALLEQFAAARNEQRERTYKLLNAGECAQPALNTFTRPGTLKFEYRLHDRTQKKNELKKRFEALETKIKHYQLCSKLIMTASLVLSIAAAIFMIFGLTPFAFTAALASLFAMQAKAPYDRQAFVCKNEHRIKQMEYDRYLSRITHLLEPTRYSNFHKSNLAPLCLEKAGDSVNARNTVTYDKEIDRSLKRHMDLMVSRRIKAFEIEHQNKESIVRHILQ